MAANFPTAAALARAVKAQWPEEAGGKPYVVCTGGEPLLQLDDAAIAALKAEGFEVGIETNGTLLPPPESTGSASAPRRARRRSLPAAMN